MSEQIIADRKRLGEYCPKTLDICPYIRYVSGASHRDWL